MTLKDQFRFVRQNMKKNKLRIFMTVLATAIGCTFLIVLASVGFGLHQSIVKETLADRVVTEISVHSAPDDEGNYSRPGEEDIRYLESLEGVKAVTRRQNLMQAPKFSFKDYETEQQATIAHMPSEVKAGFELSKGELPSEENEIIVGYHFQEQLRKKSAETESQQENQPNKAEHYEGSLIGKSIDMTVKKVIDGEEKTRTIPLIISGIGEAPSREWMKDQNIYISESILKQVESFTNTPKGMIDPEGQKHNLEKDFSGYDEVKVYTESLEDVKPVTDQIEREGYSTYSVLKEMDQINMIFTIMKAGLILIGTIAVLIASIGIYNTMTMAVTERAPDIGIMKAIGANPKTIKRIFLLESSYIGLIGAVVGTILAYVISAIVNFGLPLIIESAFQEQLPKSLKFSSIPLSLVLIAVGICLLVTIISGVRPAKRATKIDILKAMRREV
ncbi:ABC transporter permease [Salinibacillus xinjiangensis]|uniref:FtsX-like permease family protein n=1 Tax=Salinibacillus xinjiangensis TaxID=1229268 RepID=A0A6G1X9Y7_9BACI|nr:FtsX-like permease family protein [Salinibacillus xinjiangensis]MRG87757.1 FtsX-like permease family protein [Salinibacillus xinjiangensis]